MSTENCPICGSEKADGYDSKDFDVYWCGTLSGWNEGTPSCKLIASLKSDLATARAAASSLEQERNELVQHRRILRRLIQQHAGSVASIADALSGAAYALSEPAPPPVSPSTGEERGHDAG